MKKLLEKSPRESYSEISRLMLPPDANPMGNVFGGTILKMIDEIGGIVAVRHCRKNVVTASIEHMDFLYPVHIGNLVKLKARLNFVGRSSMEVGVEVYAEDLFKDEIHYTGKAIITLVAIGEDGKPTEVPKLKLENEEDRKLFKEGKRRYEERKKRMEEHRKDTTIK